MLRKLRRSVAHYQLKLMGVTQLNKKKSKGIHTYHSNFSSIWKQYDHYTPVASKRSAKAEGRADYNYETV